MESVKKWHRIINEKSIDMLEDILADDVVFYSPVLYKAQEGKELTKMYLMGAMKILLNGTFNYIHEVHSEAYSVFEFKAVVDQLEINGVDIISWNKEGKISQFKVMIRPYSGLNTLKQKMADLLESMQLNK